MNDTSKRAITGPAVAASYSPAVVARGPQLDAVYARMFPEPLPARTTVGVDLPGFKIEIDCVALLRE